MMILVIGGSGSGKSEYAEKIAESMAESMKKYYLATMQIYDEEGRRKVKRHRDLRSGKGFHTVEQPVDIHKSLAKMDAGKKTVLLECISNLVANEMFRVPETGAESKTMAETEKKTSPDMATDIVRRTEIYVARKIIKEIKMLQKETTHLVIVSNNVFEDGISYDESTMEYIRAMGYVNQKLAKMADKVIEVVVGIPLVIKECGGVRCS